MPLEGFHNGYQQRESEQIEQNADSDLRSKCGVAGGVESVEVAINCAEDVVKSEAAQSHDARDLEAQWQSATWTKLMLFVTFTLGLITVAITYWGVKLVRATLHETQRTANAAIDTLHGSRAWMTFGASAVVPIISPFGTTFRCETLWVNSGNSPAIRTTVVTFFALIDLADPIPTFDKDRPPPNQKIQPTPRDSGGIIGPNSNLVMLSDQFSHSDFMLTQRGLKRLIVYCYVQYFDIFNPDKMRVSQGCWEGVFHRMETSPEKGTYPLFDFMPRGDGHIAT
jgi:hypothetical protein